MLFFSFFILIFFPGISVLYFCILFIIIGRMLKNNYQKFDGAVRKARMDVLVCDRCIIPIGQDVINHYNNLHQFSLNILIFDNILWNFKCFKVKMYIINKVAAIKKRSISEMELWIKRRRHIVVSSSSCVHKMTAFYFFLNNSLWLLLVKPSTRYIQ